MDVATGEEIDAHASARLSVAIMGVRQRRDSIDRLQVRLAPVVARVSYELTPAADPDPMASAAEAWRHVPSDSTHHLVLQDDVEPCRDFLAAVARAALLRPDDALAFFAEWGCKSASTIRIAAMTGACWAEAVDKYAHTQALLLPADVARDLGAHLGRQAGPAPPEDVVVHDFLARQGVREFISVPNLVEHLDLPSLTGNTWQGRRRAVCFRAEPPVLTHTTVAGLPTYPFYQWRTGRTWHLTRDGTVDGGWRRVALGPVLAWHGWTPAETAGALASRPRLTARLTAQETEHIAGVVDVAAALVMTAWALRPAGDATEAYATLGAAALDTLGDGSLRHVLPAATLDAVREDVGAVVVHVVERASRLLATGGLRPLSPRTDPSVV